ncbi:MAG TPA: ribulose-phosphate 3-epimerase [bacterium]|nr:ribulose-phosphate 3-epimerase [bacterium]
MNIAPSILAADFGRLAEQVRAVERAGAGRIHIDVMDGRFVPEITMGPGVTRSIRRATALPLDVHLMVVEPGRQVQAFAEAGATSLAVHVEAAVHLHQTLRQIRASGLRPSVALNPATPLDAIEWVLPEVAAVLIMTVEPGSGGQPFIPEMVAKVRDLAEGRRARGLDFEIAVDGGITAETAPAAVEAGASVLVCGTAVFGAPDGIEAAMARLRRAAGRGPRRS